MNRNKPHPKRKQVFLCLLYGACLSACTMQGPPQASAPSVQKQQAHALAPAIPPNPSWWFRDERALTLRFDVKLKRSMGSLSKTTTLIASDGERALHITGVLTDLNFGQVGICDYPRYRFTPASTIYPDESGHPLPPVVLVLPCSLDTYNLDAAHKFAFSRENRAFGFANLSRRAALVHDLDHPLPATDEPGPAPYPGAFLLEDYRDFGSAGLARRSEATLMNQGDRASVKLARFPPKTYVDYELQSCLASGPWNDFALTSDGFDESFHRLRLINMLLLMRLPSKEGEAPERNHVGTPCASLPNSGPDSPTANASAYAPSASAHAPSPPDPLRGAGSRWDEASPILLPFDIIKPVTAPEEFLSVAPPAEAMMRCLQRALANPVSALGPFTPANFLTSRIRELEGSTEPWPLYAWEGASRMLRRWQALHDTPALAIDAVGDRWNSGAVGLIQQAWRRRSELLRSEVCALAATSAIAAQVALPCEP